MDVKSKSRASHERHYKERHATAYRYSLKNNKKQNKNHKNEFVVRFLFISSVCNTERYELILKD